MSRRHEHAREYAQKDEEDTVVDYNAPVHWWMVSTLFPLIAGTFGPMASMSCFAIQEVKSNLITLQVHSILWPLL